MNLIVHPAIDIEIRLNIYFSMSRNLYCYIFTIKLRLTSIGLVSITKITRSQKKKWKVIFKGHPISNESRAFTFLFSFYVPITESHWNMLNNNSLHFVVLFLEQIFLVCVSLQQDALQLNQANHGIWLHSVDVQLVLLPKINQAGKCIFF